MNLAVAACEFHLTYSISGEYNKRYLPPYDSTVVAQNFTCTYDFFGHTAGGVLFLTKMTINYENINKILGGNFEKKKLKP